MILDSLLLFTGLPTATTIGLVVGNTDHTDSPISGATGVSSNVIDLHLTGIPVLASGAGARDMGIGDDPSLKMLVQVMASFSGSASTFTLALQGAPDNGSGAPGTFVDWWRSPAYSQATLVVGARLYDMDLPRPPALIGIPRFLRLGYNISGTTSYAAGSILGTIVLDRIDQMYQGTSNVTLGGYPPGIVISN